MRAIKDKGALLAALVAIVLALVSWTRADAGRSQQLTDLTQRVTELQVQVQHIQSEWDQFLFKHDGH